MISSSEKDENVILIASPQLISTANLLPSNMNRSSLVHALIHAYKLHKNLQIRSPTLIDKNIMSWAVEDEFLEILTCSKIEKLKNISEEYGLVDDCPVFPQLSSYVQQISSATWTAASVLEPGKPTISIVWDGGRHHAQRNMASGFCYINDLVIGITELLSRFEKVLYIDLDIHHGDGVEEAFRWNDSVLTLSFHLSYPGFFPATGTQSIAEEGALNVPLRPGLRGENLVKLFKQITDKTREKFQPDVIVLQCGGDCLTGDPLVEGGGRGIVGWNVGTKAIQQCLQHVMEWNLPILMTGGGGYHHANVARLNAMLVATACRVDLPQDIPEHDLYEEYAPLFTLHVEEGQRMDENEASAQDSRRMVQTGVSGLYGKSWMDHILDVTIKCIEEL